MEKTLFDKYFSGYLLKKRKIWKPFKYNINPTYLVTRWHDALVLPKNRLESIFSNVFERSLPVLTYFTWRDAMVQAREDGWTIQEKFFNHFFRQKNIYYHAYSQQLHPWSYIDRQRADQFFRRVQTLIPGVECPAWARQNRRVPEVDFESMLNVAGAYNQVAQEATPSPHYNTPNYFTVQHFFNNRFNFGVYGARVLFNEEPRGDFFATGYYSKADLDTINSWYAGDRNAILQKILSLSEEERNGVLANLERWRKNFEIYFPETKNIKVEPTSHKHAQEPYHVRSADELREKIFLQKYLNAQKSNAFSSAEWDAIREVFLAGVDNHFFELSEHDGQYHATALFKKFTQVFDLPDFFSLTSKSGKTPEAQYIDKTEVRWGVNFHSISVARETFDELLRYFETHNNFWKGLSNSGISVADYNRLERDVRSLLLEETYNPLFVNRLGGSENVVSSNINSVDDVTRLIDVMNQTKDEVRFLNRKVFSDFLVRNRRVIQSIPFVPSN